MAKKNAVLPPPSFFFVFSLSRRDWELFPAILFPYTCVHYNRTAVFFPYIYKIATPVCHLFVICVYSVLDQCGLVQTLFKGYSLYYWCVVHVDCIGICTVNAIDELLECISSLCDLHLTLSPTCYCTHSRMHSLSHSFIHSLTHPLTHSLIHLLTHSPTHSLTYSPTHSYSLTL